MCIRDRYKLIAFTISAALAGLAGALYAHNFSSLVAKKFDYNTSILILVFVVVAVSYTHLDVYKRQPPLLQSAFHHRAVCAQGCI